MKGRQSRYVTGGESFAEIARRPAGTVVILSLNTDLEDGHCCKVSDEAAFCLIQRPYISKTLLTRRISPRGSP